MLVAISTARDRIDLLRACIDEYCNAEAAALSGLAVA